MLGEAQTPRVLPWVRGCSWQVGPTAAAGAGRALVSGVRAVLPGPVPAQGCLVQLGCFPSSLQRQVDHLLSTSCLGDAEGRWDGEEQEQGTSTAAVLSRTGRPRQVSSNGTHAALHLASLQEQADGPVTDQEPLGR